MKRLKLYKGENIILSTRSSKWFLVLRMLRTSLILGLIITTLSSLLLFAFLENFYISIPLVIFLIVTLASCTYHYTLWRNPVFYLTNKRIIFDHQRSLFSSQNVEMKINNISEITVPKISFMGTVFGFGSMDITPISGGSGKIEIKYMPKVRKVANAITNLLDGEDEWFKSKNEPDEFDHENILKEVAGVHDLFEMNYQEKDFTADKEHPTNRGAYEVLRRKKVFCLLISQDFPYRQTKDGEHSISISFDHITDSIVAFPSQHVHALFMQRFQKEGNYYTVLVGV